MKKITKKYGGYVIEFVIIAFIIGIITIFVGQCVDVSGASMEPAFHNGDRLILEKMTDDFERFDVVVFKSTISECNYIIKRVIGLPGETVQIISGGTILINGEPIDDIYAKEPIAIGNEGLAINPITLKEDEYFVLGDNRNNSTDSRFEGIGNVKRKDIVGKICYQLLPYGDIGKID